MDMLMGILLRPGLGLLGGFGCSLARFLPWLGVGGVWMVCVDGDCTGSCVFLVIEPELEPSEGKSPPSFVSGSCSVPVVEGDLEPSMGTLIPLSVEPTSLA
ncbi:hypothetical protein DL95DRAFT_384499 [Leptodontidium sp. 2 PMI_412]|nr:hypothetical protein DL95DRAFT_384499 [Leptodontidium sp. 2 PMI_412]